MLEYFKSKFSNNNKVIIDCTEFRIGVPAGFDNRALTYSKYKRGFTAKLLIGVTPGEFISFKSKVAGGKKNDSQMIIESGLLDFLEDGDVVLVDKGFSGIKTSIGDCGKKSFSLCHHFYKKKNQNLQRMRQKKLIALLVLESTSKESLKD